jgi:hypothetical protein
MTKWHLVKVTTTREYVIECEDCTVDVISELRQSTNDDLSDFDDIDIKTIIGAENIDCAKRHAHEVWELNV